MATPTLPNVHDAVLQRVSVDWPAATVDVELHPVPGDPLVITAYGVGELHVDRWEPRGRARSSTAPRSTKQRPAKSGFGSRCRAAIRFLSSPRSSISLHPAPQPHQRRGAIAPVGRPTRGCGTPFRDRRKRSDQRPHRARRVEASAARSAVGLGFAAVIVGDARAAVTI
jgi:hypothetical protein